MGVCTHSDGRTGNATYVIFSIDPAHRDYLLEYMMHNSIGYKQLIGKYKGEEEVSYIVNYGNYAKIRAVGFVGGQESILYLTEMRGRVREASLIYLDSRGVGVRVEQLGAFKQTLKSYAERCEAYTYDPSDGSYWITDNHKMMGDIADGVSR